ncbi:hypothetical protein OG936_13920 [Streptomyces sp. NBC_00846]|uniref:hypothetical protein n=1 Tax=Streptomyces sp. NBC_00846 TaxID=2975849 RepID=UPI0038695287|nr:hypothetical protein OG936_13920 [Streptomyces sp. NBC_00846]
MLFERTLLVHPARTAAATAAVAAALLGATAARTAVVAPHAHAAPGVALPSTPHAAARAGEYVSFRLDRYGGLAGCRCSQRCSPSALWGRRNGMRDG